MKIAIVYFPINDAGGINSWCENSILGFRRLGHEVDLLHMTPGVRMKCFPDRKHLTNRKVILPGKFVSYRDGSEAQRVLNGYDFVIFLHPAPHPTGANIDAPGIDNWKKLYDIDPPTLMVMHDEKWQETNFWIRDVRDKVNGVMAAQHRFMPAAESYQSDAIKWWDYFPLDVPDQADFRKPPAPFGIVATQWIQWKNHKHFLPMIPEIETPISMYGSGIEYSYLNRDGAFDEFGIVNHVHPGKVSDSIHQYFGFVAYEEVMDAMKQAVFSIDLSTRGYTNMTHWEPLMYGTISMMERHVFEDKYNEIPGECCWVYNFNDLPEEIEGLMAYMDLPNRDHDIQKNGFEFIQRTSRCEDVCKRILEKMGW